MATVRVHTDIAASPEQVWAAVADIASHVLWMGDALAIRVTSPRSIGVGTTFECDTRVGPFRVTDEMEITRWRPHHQMGVHHQGLVGGTGMFSIEPAPSSPWRRRTRGGRSGPVTRFRWTEHLEFPWYLGGAATALAAAPVLHWIWRRNLATLRRLVEAGAL